MWPGWWLSLAGGSWEMDRTEGNWVPTADDWVFHPGPDIPREALCRKPIAQTGSRFPQVPSLNLLLLGPRDGVQRRAGSRSGTTPGDRST